MVTNLLVLLTVILSLISFSNQELMRRLIFNPYMVTEHKQWYRFISSGFIHADFMHLLINMIVLWSFGRVVENDFHAIFGQQASYYFILLYLGGLVISITPSFKRNKHNAAYNALGASGAVSAILFTAILLRPLDNIYLYGIIGIPAIILGVGYLVYSYYMDKRGGGAINHDAHFWGAVFGFLFTILLKPKLALYFIDQITGFL
jgi:membrane associated rhomboid family serine protease